MELTEDPGSRQEALPWDDVFRAIRRCHQVLREMGVPRISTSIKVGTRSDREQTMQQKIDSVDRRLGRM